MKTLFTILLTVFSFLAHSQEIIMAGQPYRVNSTPPPPPISVNAFKTVWVIPSSSYTVSLTFSSGLNNFYIYWGDGTVEHITTTGTKSHTYATAGTDTISIDGTCKYFATTSTGRAALRDIAQWGNIGGVTTFSVISSGLTTISATSSSTFFNGCTSLASAFS